MKRDPDAALTLVEMLATLGVIAAATSLTMLSLAGYGRSGSAHDEAVRLAVSVNGATDAALTSGRQFTFMPVTGGYAIAPAGTDDKLTNTVPQQTLPDDVRLLLRHTTAEPPLIGGIFADTFDVALRGPSESWLVRFDGLTATVHKNGGKAIVPDQ